MNQSVWHMDLLNLSSHHDLLPGDLITSSHFIYIFCSLPVSAFNNMASLIWNDSFSIIPLSKCSYLLWSLHPEKFSFPLQIQLICEFSWTCIQNMAINTGTAFLEGSGIKEYQFHCLDINILLFVTLSYLLILYFQSVGDWTML